VINALSLHDPAEIGGYQHVGQSIDILRGIWGGTHSRHQPNRNRADMARKMIQQCLDFIQKHDFQQQREMLICVYCKSGRHRIRLGWGWGINLNGLGQWMLDVSKPYEYCHVWSAKSHLGNEAEI
jgi:hypothetical protein